jgi:hypothetical protein
MRLLSRPITRLREFHAPTFRRTSFFEDGLNSLKREGEVIKRTI